MLEAVKELIDLRGVLRFTLGLLEALVSGRVVGVGNKGGNCEGFQDWFEVVIFGEAVGGVL